MHDIRGSVFALLLPFIVFSPAQARTGSLWSRSTAPANIVDPDANSLELGVKFTGSVNGTVSGNRFYKSPMNAGNHTVSLWSSARIKTGDGDLDA